MESEVTKEMFEELLDTLAESHSVKIKLLGTRISLCLPKLDQCSICNENSNETSAINANQELL